MFWKTLGRLILIAFACFASALTTLTVFITLGLEHLTQQLHGSRNDDADLVIVFEVLAHSLVLFPALTLVPALTIVIVGEVSRIRSFLYYLVGGGVALVTIPLLAKFGSYEQATSLPEEIVWPIFATAGFAGGALYWLIAGRNA